MRLETMASQILFSLRTSFPSLIFRHHMLRDIACSGQVYKDVLSELLDSKDHRPHHNGSRVGSLQTISRLVVGYHW